ARLGLWRFFAARVFTGPALFPRSCAAGRSRGGEASTSGYQRGEGGDDDRSRQRGRRGDRGQPVWNVGADMVRWIAAGAGILGTGGGGDPDYRPLHVLQVFGGGAEGRTGGAHQLPHAALCGSG